MVTYFAITTIAKHKQCNKHQSLDLERITICVAYEA